MGFAGKMIGFGAVEKLFQHINPPKPATVVVKAEHGVFVEYGTSRMPPQPFLRPGIAKAMASFKATEARAGDMSALIEALAESIAKEARALAPVATGELRDSIGVEK